MKKRIQKFATILGAAWIALFSMLPANNISISLDQSLETAIVQVKEVITVPKELTEFEYHSTIDGQTGKMHYYLSWYDPGYEKGNVHVEIDEEGSILSYDAYFYGKEEQKDLSLSYEQGIKKAEAFIGTINPKVQGDIVLGAYVAPGMGNTYTYVFDHVVNGVKVFEESFLVDVDKYTGEVVRFNGFSSFKGAYEKTDAPLTLQEAIKIYTKEVEIPLMYQLKRDYTKRTIESFPLYSATNLYNYAIDATTGEVFTPLREERYITYAGGAKQESADSGAERPGLTPSEQAEVDAAQNLLDPDTLFEQAKKHFKNLEKFKVERTNLSKNAYTNQYIWQIALQTKAEEYGYSYLQVDAKTGEIMSYYGYSDIAKEGTSKVSYEKAKQEVEALLKALDQSGYAKTKEVVQDKEMGQSYYNFYYQRQENGLPVEGNGYYISYDGQSGSIVSYQKSWENIPFAKVMNPVSKESIVNKLGLELQYVTKEDGKRVLAYITNEYQMAFNPTTGERINAYDGAAYEEESVGMYADLENHPAREYVKGLMDRGIRLSGESFKPDTRITQGDFLRLLLGLTGSSWDEERVGENAVTRGILTKEELNFKKEVTLEEAIRYTVHHLGYKKVAQLQNIFRLPTQNHQIKNENIGYAALTLGLQVIDETDLQMDQSTTLTRAKAAEMVYKMLLNQ
jgi:hypothetical protein